MLDGTPGAASPRASVGGYSPSPSPRHLGPGSAAAGLLHHYRSSRGSSPTAASAAGGGAAAALAQHASRLPALHAAAVAAQHHHHHVGFGPGSSIGSKHPHEEGEEQDMHADGVQLSSESMGHSMDHDMQADEDELMVVSWGVALGVRRLTSMCFVSNSNSVVLNGHVCCEPAPLLQSHCRCGSRRQLNLVALCVPPPVPSTRLLPLCFPCRRGPWASRGRPGPLHNTHIYSSTLC